MTRYIAKPGTWFDEGTEATRLCDGPGESGVYAGTKDGHPDEECCPDDEFVVIEDEA